jgi:hypothetical protein
VVTYLNNVDFEKTDCRRNIGLAAQKSVLSFLHPVILSYECFERLVKRCLFGLLSLASRKLGGRLLMSVIMLHGYAVCELCVSSHLGDDVKSCETGFLGGGDFVVGRVPVWVL